MIIIIILHSSENHLKILKLNQLINRPEKLLITSSMINLINFKI